MLENPDAFPRAWMTHEVWQSDADNAATLASGEVDPAVTTPVESPAPAVQPLHDGATEPITFVERSLEVIRLTQTVAADGVLMLSEPYDRGWNAYVDGEEVPILRADHLFRAIAPRRASTWSSSGYEPVELSGLAISGLTIPAVVPGFLLALRRRNRTGAP
ncbi:MAG: hypothetical protein R2843_15685 [Thermomicrobiales bacterium]